MLQEIYYTSAPRGLKAGSRGFCTVVSTPGMAKNLADRLEALSGYRHVFAPQDPQAAFNPVLWSHLRMSVGGRPYHVLSRICDAGLDYTQRTNKFAHHVALDAVDLPQAGPAWLLAAPEFMQSTWDGEPRTVAAARRAPSGSIAPGICHAWQHLTGDAGWGGALAETALSDARRQAVVVYSPGMDVLPLVAESLALLPPPSRWDVTFSTYFTKLPPGVECKWRFVVEASPEAAAARATPQTLLIDLCAPLPVAKGGALIEAARTGVVSSTAIISAAGGGTVAGVAQATDATGEIGLLELDESAGLRPARVAASVSRPGHTGAYGIGPPPVPGLSDVLPSASSPLRKRKKKRRWFVIAGVGSAVLVALGAVLLTLILLRHGPGRIAIGPTNGNGPATTPEPKKGEEVPVNGAADARSTDDRPQQVLASDSTPAEHSTENEGGVRSGSTHASPGNDIQDSMATQSRSISTDRFKHKAATGDNQTQTETLSPKRSSPPVLTAGQQNTPMEDNKVGSGDSSNGEPPLLDSSSLWLQLLPGSLDLAGSHNGTESRHATVRAPKGITSITLIGGNDSANDPFQFSLDADKPHSTWTLNARSIALGESNTERLATIGLLDGGFDTKRLYHGNAWDQQLAKLRNCALVIGVEGVSATKTVLFRQVEVLDSIKFKEIDAARKSSTKSRIRRIPMGISTKQISADFDVTRERPFSARWSFVPSFSDGLNWRLTARTESNQELIFGFRIDEDEKSSEQAVISLKYLDYQPKLNATKDGTGKRSGKRTVLTDLRKLETMVNELRTETGPLQKQISELEIAKKRSPEQDEELKTLKNDPRLYELKSAEVLLNLKDEIQSRTTLEFRLFITNEDNQTEIARTKGYPVGK